MRRRYEDDFSIKVSGLIGEKLPKARQIFHNWLLKHAARSDRLDRRALAGRSASDADDLLLPDV
jgi:hypothetical protein